MLTDGLVYAEILGFEKNPETEQHTIHPSLFNNQLAISFQ